MQPTNNSEFWDKNLNNYYHLIQSAGFFNTISHETENKKLHRKLWTEVYPEFNVDDV